MSEVTLSQRCLVELQQYHRSYVGDVEKPILILANSECSPEELVNKKAGYKAIPNTDRFVRADIKDGKRRGGSFEIRIPGVFNRNISSQIIAPRKHFDTSGPFSSKLDEFERELPGIESVDYSLLQLVQSPHMTKTLELAGPEKIQRIYSEIQHYLKDRKITGRTKEADLKKFCLANLQGDDFLAYNRMLILSIALERYMDEKKIQFNFPSPITAPRSISPSYCDDVKKKPN